MTQPAADALQVISLSSDDVDEVFSLYQLNRSIAPYGFMAIRTKSDYRKMLSAPPSMIIRTGLRTRKDLIAYAFCHRIPTNPYKHCPLSSSIDPQASTVYHGAGAVVHPDFHRLGIGKRLMQLRLLQMTDRQVDHFFGLIAVDNLPSIATNLHAGCLLAGFARDQTALNYVMYWGRLRQALPTDAVPTLVPITERKHHRRLFRKRHVICGLSRVMGGTAALCRNTDRQFEFLPINFDHTMSN
jgi:hypothetical protein